MRAVALRKESVDRNIEGVSLDGKSCAVALRKESVDRNIAARASRRTYPVSLSARRAWIEIKKIGRLLLAVRVALRKESVDRNKRSPTAGQLGAVALRKESVDRNRLTKFASLRSMSSLSARRAWIEIVLLVNGGALSSVALRKESVDRNLLMRFSLNLIVCRSPQGERG